MAEDSEESKQDGNSKDDQPQNMHEKEGLARNRRRTAVADLTKSHVGDLDTGTQSIGTTTPVGNAINPADRIRPKAFDGARRREGQRTEIYIAVVIGGFRRQADGVGNILRSDCKDEDEKRKEENDGNRGCREEDHVRRALKACVIGARFRAGRGRETSVMELS